MKKTFIFTSGLVAALLATQSVFAVAPPPPPGEPGAGPGPGDRLAPAGQHGAMFERIDRNGDGVIDKAEFQSVANELRRRFGRGGEGRGPDAAPDRPRGPGRGRFQNAPGMAGEGPEGGPPDERIREIVREAVREVLHENSGRLHELIRDAVERAMHGDRGEGPGPGEGAMELRREARPRAGVDRNAMPRRHGAGRGRFAPPPPVADGPLPPPPGALNDAGPGREPGAMNQKPGRGRGAGRRGPDAGKVDGHRLFERMDRNKDGAITPDEFKGNQKRFSKLDANGDGRLDPEEMKAAAQRLMKRRGEGGRQPGRPVPPPQGVGVSI